MVPLVSVAMLATYSVCLGGTGSSQKRGGKTLNVIETILVALVLLGVAENPHTPHETAGRCLKKRLS